MKHESSWAFRDTDKHWHNDIMDGWTIPHYMHLISSAAHMFKCKSGATPDNTHMAPSLCPTFHAYRAFTHSSGKPAHLFHCGVRAFRASSQLAAPPGNPATDRVVKTHCPPSWQCNCMQKWIFSTADAVEWGLALHAGIRLTFSAGMPKTLSWP